MINRIEATQSIVILVRINVFCALVCVCVCVQESYRKVLYTYKYLCVRVNTNRPSSITLRRVSYTSYDNNTAQSLRARGPKWILITPPVNASYDGDCERARSIFFPPFFFYYFSCAPLAHSLLLQYYFFFIREKIIEKYTPGANPFSPISHARSNIPFLITAIRWSALTERRHRVIMSSRRTQHEPFSSLHLVIKV